MTVSGGDQLARALADAGVTEVFALHGGHLDAFLVACGNTMSGSPIRGTSPAPATPRTPTPA